MTIWSQEVFLFITESQKFGIEISTKFIQSNSKIYDLGCSTGTNLINLNKDLQKLGIKNCKYYGIDNSKPMIEMFKKKIKKNKIRKNFKLIASDFNELKFEKNVNVFLWHTHCNLLDLWTEKD